MAAILIGRTRSIQQRVPQGWTCTGTHLEPGRTLPTYVHIHRHVGMRPARLSTVFFVRELADGMRRGRWRATLGSALRPPLRHPPGRFWTT
jgi:hypothetical protein